MLCKEKGGQLTVTAPEGEHYVFDEDEVSSSSGIDPIDTALATIESEYEKAFGKQLRE